MKKRILSLIGVMVIGLLVLTGCNNAEKTANAQATMTAEELLIKLKEKNENIGRYVVYTEETDLNSLLGRPNQYTSKVTFEDKRLEQTNLSLDSKYFTQEEINEPTGGTIEVFKTEEDLIKRKKYVETITSSMSALVEYSYSDGIYLLRLNKDLTPSQAKEYEEIFYSIVK